MKSNKYFSKLIPLLFMFALLFAACELIDPTDVENPAITEEKLFADATGGAEPLVTGLEFAFSDAVVRSVVFLEAVSDNYDNISTYVSTVLDKPRNITPNDQYLGDSREIYFKLQILRSLADFGLSTVLPADANSTTFHEAQALFYKGMAILMLSENFLAFPLVEDGPMVRAENAVKEAIEVLEESYSISPSGDHGLKCKLALARAYRLDKNKAMAVQMANEVLSMNPTFNYSAQYDAINLPNRMVYFLVTRSQNDFQPLPRLDFLDPKFSTPDASDGIPCLKAEEAYLILAEAALSDNDINTTKGYLNDLIVLVDSRQVYTFSDNDPRRNRPSNPDYIVKADASAPGKPGLILAREDQEIAVSPVSGTSLTNADIDAMTTPEELYYALYLLRQEVFFAEGRRMSDLGIRLPVMQRQIDANPNINIGDYGTEIYVPAYIPQSDEMDQFTVDETNGIVTILHDMNRVLVQNINVVSPF
ncbi:MAG: hypothetical protein JW995_11640 [Melioribacteraceae bacterium]|nr:hypothetical protein [Melioribacteraceae bacterium]